jgi:hypothetical protein
VQLSIRILDPVCRKLQKCGFPGTPECAPVIAIHVISPASPGPGAGIPSHTRAVVNPDMTRIQLKVSSSTPTLLLEAQTAAAPDIDRQLIIEFKRAKFPKAISPPILVGISSQVGRPFWPIKLAREHAARLHNEGEKEPLKSLCTLYVRSGREFLNELVAQN